MEGARGQAEGRNNFTNSAEYVADQLYAGGAGRWGTDENAFIDIITGYNRAEIQQICAAYEVKYKSSLEAAIKSEFSGELETALIALINGIQLSNVTDLIILYNFNFSRPHRFLLPPLEGGCQRHRHQRGGH